MAYVVREKIDILERKMDLMRDAFKELEKAVIKLNLMRYDFQELEKAVTKLLEDLK